MSEEKLGKEKGKILHKKTQIVIGLVSLLPIVLTAAVYGKLPEQIPTHWGFNGQISYSGKSQIWMIAGMCPVFAILFYILPSMDPKKRNYQKFSGVYESFQLFLQIFLMIITGIIITESFWPGTIQVSVVVTALCSVLCMFIGNMMPKFRQNFFCGFRTPWALSDETVWNKTHRLGGRMLFGAGIAGLIGAFLPGEKIKMGMLLVPLAVATVIPYIMSYIWFQKQQEEKS